VVAIFLPKIGIALTAGKAYIAAGDCSLRTNTQTLAAEENLSDWAIVNVAFTLNKGTVAQAEITFL